MKKIKYLQVFIGIFIFITSLVACNTDGRVGVTDPKKSDNPRPPQGKLGVAIANSDAQVQIGLSAYTHIFQTINMALRADDYSRDNMPSACWGISAEPPVDPEAKKIFVDIDWRNCKQDNESLRGRERVTIYLGSFSQDDYFDKHKFHSLEVQSITPVSFMTNIKTLSLNKKLKVTLENYRLELRNKRSEDNQWDLNYTSDLAIESQALQSDNGKIDRRFEVEAKGTLKIDNSDALEPGASIPVSLLNSGSNSLTIRYLKTRTDQNRDNVSEEQVLDLKLTEETGDLTTTTCGVPVGSLSGAFHFGNDNTSVVVHTDGREIINSLASKPKIPWNFNCQSPMGFLKTYASAITNLKEHADFRSSKPLTGGSKNKAMDTQ